MSRNLRIALFGMGKMGQHHIKAIELQESAQLVAIADPNIDSEEYRKIIPSGVEVFKDAGTLLDAAKPDVVHIVTPPNTHVALAKMALEAGAHIYVEKPFALTGKEAEDVAAVASERKLKVCPAHQVQFQESGQKYRKYLPLIGDVVHVESYFSFKTVRASADGKGAIRPIDQLIDILPHPVYLMLGAFESDSGVADKSELVMKSVEASASGDVHAIFKQGDKTGVLIVTLRGRPIESYLKIIGTNGLINADFILSGVMKNPGPGASAIALVLMPFSQAFQKMFGTIGTIFRMVFKKHKSYAGLAELIEAFYASINEDTKVPVSTTSLLNTVKICELIGEKLKVAEQEEEEASKQILEAIEKDLRSPDESKHVVLVTGGTGFLGKVLIKELRDRDWPVRVIARRIPASKDKIPGAMYVEGDISEPLPDDCFSGVGAIAHLAAETAGGKEAHERNTIQATRHLLESAGKHNIKRFINISSIAVLKPSSKVGHALNEDSPVDIDNIGRGPYVWGKAKAEQLASEISAEKGFSAKTIRLGPLVDFGDFTPPGRLGREVGPLFVSMGNPWDKLSVCDVQTASNVIRYYVEHFDDAPTMLNLVEADAPSRSDLVKKLKQKRKELTAFWMFTPILQVLSFSLKVVLKLLKPRSKPLDVYAAFASERYDATLAGQMIDKARLD